MPNLEPALRKNLEKTIVKARTAAEHAATQALGRLGVAQDKAPEHLSETERKMRNTLRQKARQLGGTLEKGYGQLMTEVAYAHWHRMLFAAFLEIGRAHV